MTVESMGLDEAVQSLIDLANERGGHDNITIILIDIPAPGVLQAGEAGVEITQPISTRVPSPVATAAAGEAAAAETTAIAAAPAAAATNPPATAARQAGAPVVEEELAGKKERRRKRMPWLVLSCLGMVTIAGLALVLFSSLGLFAIFPGRAGTQTATQTPTVVSTTQPALPVVTSTSTPLPTSTATPLAPPGVLPTYTPWPTSTPTPVIPAIFLPSPKPPG